MTKANEKNDRLQSSYNQLLVKFNEGEEKLKEANKVSKQQGVQLAQVSNELEGVRKEHANLNNEYNSLSAKHLNLTQKLNDTKSKLDAEK